jgi:cell wall-associated NlpC family hydrolase
MPTPVPEQPASQPSTPPPPPPPTARDDAVSRAKTGVGFSYWWGGGAWLPPGPNNNAGTCTGNCPSCTHTGTYGADCSGYVAKIWQVPASNNDVTVNSHPYSTYNFNYEHEHWSDVPRANAKKADALVYNVNGHGHIFLFESGDPWGSMWTYEARGCLTGIVHNLRTADNTYKAIAREGW